MRFGFGDAMLRRFSRWRKSWITLAVVSLSLTAVTAAIAQSKFDHFTTGYPLEGAHRFADCESCHTDGLFEGTPTQCEGCHSQSSRVNAAAKPAFHNPTSDRCGACHHPSDWQSILRVDHLEVMAECAACHDGRRAPGKPIGHLMTNDQCDDCHRTTAFVPAVFDHAGIVGGCLTCHNGLQALGKPVSHIPATDTCEDCHSTVSWSPVSRVDHMQVIGSCSSCHNGVIATGQHPAHIPTTAECDSCHNTIAWR